jgi:hypothetical protein
VQGAAASPHCRAQEPTLVEIAYLKKRKSGLPIARLGNPRRQQNAA